MFKAPDIETPEAFSIFIRPTSAPEAKAMFGAAQVTESAVSDDVIVTPSPAMKSTVSVVVSASTWGAVPVSALSLILI